MTLPTTINYPVDPSRLTVRPAEPAPVPMKRTVRKPIGEASVDTLKANRERQAEIAAAGAAKREARRAETATANAARAAANRARQSALLGAAFSVLEDAHLDSTGAELSAEEHEDLCAALAEMLAAGMAQARARREQLAALGRTPVAPLVDCSTWFEGCLTVVSSLDRTTTVELDGKRYELAANAASYLPGDLVEFGPQLESLMLRGAITLKAPESK